MSNRVQSILVFLAYIFMVIMNGLSSAGLLGGRTLQDISYTPHQILVPAAFTFGIWGVIYLGLLAFSIYQLRKDTLHDNTIQKIRPLVILNFIANGLRLPAAIIGGWTRMSVILIIVLWVSLGHINKHLQGHSHNAIKKRYIILPMSIYFGWVTIATPLNIASYLNELGVSQAVVSPIRVLGRIGLAYITSLVVFTKLRYLSYIAVLLWALIGVIVARQYDAPQIAWIGLILGIAAIIYIILRIAQKKVIIQ